MLPALVALFIVVPIAELAVIIQVGQLLGVWETIALLVVASVAGSILVRAQGRAAWRRLDAAVRSGRPPAREAIDGALVIAGGALLLTPGFLTDLVGIALLAPPTRAVIRRLLVRRLTRQALARVGAQRPRRPAPDVEATGADVDPRLFPG